MPAGRGAPKEDRRAIGKRSDGRAVGRGKATEQKRAGERGEDGRQHGPARPPPRLRRRLGVLPLSGGPDAPGQRAVSLFFTRAPRKRDSRDRAMIGAFATLRAVVQRPRARIAHKVDVGVARRMTGVARGTL